MTLVEVLVSLGVMQVGVLGTMALVSTLFHSGQFARDMSEASRLVQSRLEALDSVAGVTLSSPPSGSSVEPPMNAFGVTSSVGPFTRTTTWSTTSDGLRRHVDVVVTWADARGRVHRAQSSRDRVP